MRYEARLSWVVDLGTGLAGKTPATGHQDPAVEQAGRGVLEADHRHATEAGFKEGEAIRVFPFGYVAHDEAADPAAPLGAAITVDADGLISRLAVGWGSAGSAWTYTVTYTDLGSTEPIVAPENAQPFPRRNTAAPTTGGGSGNGN